MVRIFFLTSSFGRIATQASRVFSHTALIAAILNIEWSLNNSNKTSAKR